MLRSLFGFACRHRGMLLVAAILACAVLLDSPLVALAAYVPATDAYTQLRGLSGLQGPADGVEHLILELVPDNEYPTGGFTTLGLAAHATGGLDVLGLVSILHALAEPTIGGYVPVWNRATGKILVFRIPEIGAAGAGDDNEAAQPLEEVAAGVDLSAQKIVLHVYGVRDRTIGGKTMSAQGDLS